MEPRQIEDDYVEPPLSVLFREAYQVAAEAVLQRASGYRIDYMRIQGAPCEIRPGTRWRSSGSRTSHDRVLCKKLYGEYDYDRFIALNPDQFFENVISADLARYAILELLFNETADRRADFDPDLLEAWRMTEAEAQALHERALKRALQNLAQPANLALVLDLARRLLKEQQFNLDRQFKAKLVF